MENNIHTVSVPGSAKAFTMDAASLGSGMAFLVGELEKRDPKLLEPMTSTTWQRDIVAKTGGGWVEYSSNYFVDYGTVGANKRGIIGGQTTAIPTLQANITKDNWRVFTWANIIKVPFVDQQKLQGIGRSLDEIYDKGLRLNYNKMLDENVYTGFAEYQTEGLVNNSNVTASMAAQNAAGNSTKFKDKTPDEILNDINAAITNAWANSGYDPDGIPNHIGVPPLVYSYLVSTKVSMAADKSILNYLLENNIAKANGVNLTIVPMRQLIGVGTGQTDRMIAYVNNEDKVCFDITVPLSRIMTQPSVDHMAYMTAYAGQVGQVKILYTQCIEYVDGI
jgi:hypothetical protein